MKILLEFRVFCFATTLLLVKVDSLIGNVAEFGLFGRFPIKKNIASLSSNLNLMKHYNSVKKQLN